MKIYLSNYQFINIKAMIKFKLFFVNLFIDILYINIKLVYIKNKCKIVLK